jgi:Tol biopolymer transport system component
VWQVAATAAGLLLLTLPAGGQVTTRVSVDSAGVEAIRGGSDPSISADGRFVAFKSEDRNLVAGDTNLSPDIFIHDLVTGITERVSVSSSGEQGSGASSRPAISADGRFVAFESRAWNLVADDRNPCTDVFVHDRVTGITERVSIDSSGHEGTDDSRWASISADGQLVAFYSLSPLVADDTNGVEDVFVRDRTTGITERVSVDASGAQANARSGHPSISGDGRFVAFASAASNLVAGDTNDDGDVFVHDRITGSTECISVDPAGNVGIEGSGGPAISADGRYVAFYSNSSNLIAGDTNDFGDVFVRDRSIGVTERVSVDSSGAEADLPCDFASISADGQLVAFESRSTNLVAGDTNSEMDVFVHDRTHGITERVSVHSSGAEASDGGEETSITADGQVVAFWSNSADLVFGDKNHNSDVFVHDRRISATWYNYGAGLYGTLGVPSFSSRSDPVLGTTLMLDVADSCGDYTVGLLFLGFERASIHSGWGADLLVEPAVTFLVGLSPWGNCFIQEIPDDATLAGLLVDLQVIEADPGAVKGISFTPGLELRLQY